MSEDTLWTWLKGARKYYGEGLHMRRVENMVSTGDADVDGVVLGLDFAIELKACKRPKRDSTLLAYHSVTDAQVQWHHDRWASGGASAFLLQVGTERFLISSSLARSLQRGVDMDWLHGACLGSMIYGCRLVLAPQQAVEEAAHMRRKGT